MRWSSLACEAWEQALLDAQPELGEHNTLEKGSEQSAIGAYVPSTQPQLSRIRHDLSKAKTTKTHCPRSDAYNQCLGEPFLAFFSYQIWWLQRETKAAAYATVAVIKSKNMTLCSVAAMHVGRRQVSTTTWVPFRYSTARRCTLCFARP